MRMGLVGLGIRGFWVAHLVREGAETELVAVADLREDLRALAREKLPGVEVFDSGAAMARQADIEAVVITTGDRFHAGNAREALERGKHALIEKPMAQSFEDLVTIARLQADTGLTVGTYLELRHHPTWGHVRRLIDAGAIGEVLAGEMVDHVGRDRSQFYARARTRSRDAVVSLVLQKGVHSLDLLNWYMGGRPVRVSAVGGLRFFGGTEPPDKRCRRCDRSETCPHASSAVGELQELGIEIQHDDDHCVWSQACDVEDVSLLNIEYAGGGVASYHEVHFAPYYRVHLTLYGSRAQLDVEANHDTGETWIAITERYSRAVRRETPTGDTGHGNADADLLADFAQAVRSNREPLSGLRAGFESAAVAIAARHSLDRHSFVELPGLDDL